MKIQLKEIKGLIKEKKIEESLKILHNLEEKTLNDQNIFRSQILLQLSIAELENGKHDSSKLYIQNTIELLNSLHSQNAGDIKFVQLLAQAYYTKGNVQQKMQETQAEESYEVSRQLYEHCVSQKVLFTDSDDLYSIHRNLAIIYTKKAINFIQKSNVNDAKQNVSDAYSNWVRVGKIDPDFEKLTSYKFTQIVDALVLILTGFHNEGLSQLMRIKDSIQDLISQNINIANLYLSTLAMLAQAYKNGSSPLHQSIYQKVISEFDLGVKMLENHTDYFAKQLYEQFMIIRKSQL